MLSSRLLTLTPCCIVSVHPAPPRPWEIYIRGLTRLLRAPAAFNPRHIDFAPAPPRIIRKPYA
eukprot:2855577-Pyramimonas_sp.AAC.1